MTITDVAGLVVTPAGESTAAKPASAIIGPVVADPYPWPYDTSVSAANLAVINIDWQVDFCGHGGYVDRMGYDISLTRAGLEPTRKLLPGHAKSVHSSFIPARAIRRISRTCRPTNAGVPPALAPRSDRPARPAASWSRVSRAGRSFRKSRRFPGRC